MGPQLVHHLDGSEVAKDRLKIILETIAGMHTIDEACELLGISEAMFHRLRTQVLQAGLTCLEPRPAGRPSQGHSPEHQRIAELEAALQEKDTELKATEVRLEIAQAMPQLIKDGTIKKTLHSQKHKKQTAKRRRKK